MPRNNEPASNHEHPQYPDYAFDVQFSLRDISASWRNSWLYIWGSKRQEDLGMSWHTKNQGSYHRLLGSHEKDLGANLETFPLAKDRLIWASISNSHNVLKFIKYFKMSVLTRMFKIM